MMFQDAPKEVRTRGRIYTSERERRQLDIEDTPYGRGTNIVVTVGVVDRSVTWGMYEEYATFRAKLGYWGSIQVPIDVRDTLNLSVGDTIRLTVAAE